MILVRVGGYLGGCKVSIRLNSVQLQLPVGTELGNRKKDGSYLEQYCNDPRCVVFFKINLEPP